MKVLYLIDTLEIGGAEKSLLEIISHFQTTEAIMCHIYPGEHLKVAYQTAHIPVISLNVPGAYSFRQAIQRVKALVQREQPDLIHTTLFRADIVGRFVGRLIGIPVISSFVNESYSSLRKHSLSFERRLKLQWVQQADAWTTRWCTYFTANSETVKQANVSALSVPHTKVSVIYRGRNPSPFLQITPQQIEQTREELGLQYNDRVILNVGRLLYRKGQAELIQATPAILQQYANIRLLIAGEGNYRPQLERLITELGVGSAVQLLGERTDIPILLQVAEGFIFPSHYEGYPGALIEAMFAGCPIAASDIPVHREAIRPGHTGSLFTLQEPSAIAETVMWMLAYSAEAKAMAVHAKEDALQRFHIDRIAAQHEQLYAKVLESWRSRR